MAKGACDDVAAYIAEHVASLAKAGVTLVAIAAVAPYLCARELTHRISVPLIDPIDCINDAIAERNLARVSVLGARFVMESGLYGRLNAAIVCLVPEAIAFVHDNYMKIALAGGVEGSGADVEGIRVVAQDLVENHGAEAIVLAGTDLCLAFNEANCGFPAIDALTLHVRAILQHVNSS
jgi:aspartate racemase